MHFQLAPKAVTLDDLEHQKRGFIVFWRFWDATHISRVNCVDITKDSRGKSANEIFNIIHIDFNSLKFRPHRFQEASARGLSKRGTPYKVAILSLLALLASKRVA